MPAHTPHVSTHGSVRVQRWPRSSAGLVYRPLSIRQDARASHRGRLPLTRTAKQSTFKLKFNAEEPCDSVHWHSIQVIRSQLYLSRLHRRDREPQTPTSSAAGYLARVRARHAALLCTLKSWGSAFERQRPRMRMRPMLCTCPFLGTLFMSRVSWHSSSFGRLCCVTSIYSRVARFLKPYCAPARSWAHAFHVASDTLAWPFQSHDETAVLKAPVCDIWVKALLQISDQIPVSTQSSKSYK
jgi:hypothetical protein